jgi:hypothetical protein
MLHAVDRAFFDVCPQPCANGALHLPLVQPLASSRGRGVKMVLNVANLTADTKDCIVQQVRAAQYRHKTPSSMVAPRTLTLRSQCTH